MNKKYTYLCLAIVIFIIDRITKLAALTYLQTPRAINEYLTFELMYNRGISWGMFHNATGVALVIVIITITLITAFLSWHAYLSHKRGNVIIGHVCIIAGSVANLVDRMLYGGVIDFILFSYHNYSWPVFNIADVAIVCGVAFLILVDEQSV